MAKNNMLGGLRGLAKFILPFFAAGMISCEKDANIDLRISGTAERPKYSIGEKVKLASEDYAGKAPEISGSESKLEEIRLKSRTIIPDGLRLIDAGLEEKIMELEGKPESGEGGKNGRLHAILQYEKNLTPEEREQLKGGGIEILKPLSSKTYIASLPASRQHIALTSGFGTNRLKYAGAMLPEDKIDPHILKGELGQWGKYNGMQGFTVYLHRDADMEEAIAKFEKLGAVIGGWSKSLGTISIAVEELNSKFFVDMAAELDDVEYISQPAIPLVSHLYNVRRFSKVELLQESVPGLNGEGVKICIYDGGYVYSKHKDLEGRVVYPEEEQHSSPHATHVACIAAGTGEKSREALEEMCSRATIEDSFKEICNMYLSSDNKDSFNNIFRGIAYWATLYSEDHGECDPYCLYNTPNAIEERFVFFTEQGVIVINMSIGSNVTINHYPCSFLGDYEQTSSVLDDLIYRLGIIVTKSAGNEKSFKRCWIDSRGYWTISPPAAAKNPIVVGSVTYDGGNWVELAKYSSNGPADDGHTAITVVDFGGDSATPVISCSLYSGFGYVGAAGTSMASPAAAGKAALLVQAYREIMAGMDPRPELVKGLLANNAVDLENRFVDYRTGYGMIDAVEAHKALADGRFYTGRINAAGEGNTMVLNVEDGSMLIKVMLAYTDYPAAPAAEKTLVNDLDLLLVSPSGKEYRPFVLNSQNPAAEAVRGTDSLNNIEQVVYGMLPEEGIEPGIWKVVVSGKDVVYGPVDYAVVTSHPIFDAEPAVLLNKGDSVSGYLLAGVKHNECTPGYGCNEVMEVLVDDLRLGVKSTLERDAKLQLWRIVPEYVASRLGSHWYEIGFVDDEGKLIENSDGSLAEHKAWFNVKE